MMAVHTRCQLMKKRWDTFTNDIFWHIPPLIMACLSLFSSSLPTPPPLPLSFFPDSSPLSPYLSAFPSTPWLSIPAPIFLPPACINLSFSDPFRALFCNSSCGFSQSQEVSSREMKRQFAEVEVILNLPETYRAWCDEVAMRNGYWKATVTQVRLIICTEGTMREDSQSNGHQNTKRMSVNRSSCTDSSFVCGSREEPWS